MKVLGSEVSYIKGVCNVNRMDGESNESIYRRFDVFVKGERMNYGLVRMVKHNTFRWFGHVEEMGGSEMSRRISRGQCMLWA